VPIEMYLFVYLGSALVALIAVPVSIWLAYRLDLVDVPGVRKMHSKAIPRIGGAAVFTSVTLIFVLALYLHSAIGDGGGIQAKIIVLLCAVSLVFIVGLVDDIKNLRARIKLFVQLVAAMAVCAAGIRFKSLVITESIAFDLGLLSWPISLLWIVSITNAVNLSDGLDGLAAGVSAITCFALAIIAVSHGDLVCGLLLVALLGSLTSFLFFNRNPAKVFLGDCGSLFLGFTIACASLMVVGGSASFAEMAVPVLALGIPIFDTLFSMLRRFLERRSLLSPDRSHFHHRLIDLGYSHRGAVLIIYTITSIFAGLGILIVTATSTVAIIIFVCALVSQVLVFRVVGAVRLRETLARLQHNHKVSCQRKAQIENFEDVRLHFQCVTTFDDWWMVVCLAARQLGFARLLLTLKDGGTTYRSLLWHANGEDSEMSDVFRAAIPIRAVEPKLNLIFEASVNVDGSLESAVHRTTLFCRLIEEPSTAVLLQDMAMTSEAISIESVRYESYDEQRSVVQVQYSY